MTQESTDLQRVLNEMFAAEKNFSFEVVSRWQRRFPQFSKEIAEAVTDWREFEFFALEDAEEDADLTLSDAARAATESALARFRASPPETIADLRSLAREKGFEREELLKALGVSETLMRKIERRNLSDIPKVFEEKLAALFRVSLDSLRAFFALPAQLPNAARYKSKSAPEAQPKQTFAEAVRGDPELTGEQKQKLLKTE